MPCAPPSLLTMSEHLLQRVPSPETFELSRIGWGTVVVALLVTLLSKVMKKAPNYPPGPPRDPILGNARQMTGDYIERRFAEWGKRYGMPYSFPAEISDGSDVEAMIGDVNYLEVLGQPLIVLNSYTACKDLLEKRGSIYSSRPRLVLLSEL